MTEQVVPFNYVAGSFDKTYTGDMFNGMATGFGTYTAGGITYETFFFEN